LKLQFVILVSGNAIQRMILHFYKNFPQIFHRSDQNNPLTVFIIPPKQFNIFGEELFTFAKNN